MTRHFSFQFGASATLDDTGGGRCALTFNYPLRDPYTAVGTREEMDRLMRELADWHVTNSQADLVRCEMY